MSSPVLAIPPDLARALGKYPGAKAFFVSLSYPTLAANHFVALILWAPLDRAMFHFEQETLAARRQEDLAKVGVAVFLSAYRPT